MRTSHWNSHPKNQGPHSGPYKLPLVMSNADRTKWDAKYTATAPVDCSPPNCWLRESVSCLSAGLALDLACGLGANAIFLAQAGWQVQAVDISPVGLQTASEIATQQAVQIDWIAADLDCYQPATVAFDLITVFRYLDRDNLPQKIEAALKPGGVLLYETFLAGRTRRSDNHLLSPAFVLEPGELPDLFPNLTVIEYSEMECKDRSVARLAARKPQTHSITK